MNSRRFCLSSSTQLARTRRRRLRRRPATVRTVSGTTFRPRDRFPLLRPNSAAHSGLTCTTRHRASVSKAVGRVVRQGMSRHEENNQLVVILLTTMFVDWCLTDSHNEMMCPNCLLCARRFVAGCLEFDWVVGWVGSGRRKWTHGQR